jgi:hypothetical protein
MPKNKKYYAILLCFVSLAFLLSGALWAGKAIEGGHVYYPQKKTISYGEVRLDHLRDTVDKLEKYGERSSWKNQTEAITWAKGQFEKFGIECWTETYESEEKTWLNLFARIQGKKNPSTLIMVLAHIDSISDAPQKGAPGADDNGSGIAALLESARILSRISIDKSVQFCIFTNEERGRKGSKAFARRAREKGLNIEAVINMDILGYNRPNSPIDLMVITSHGSFKNRAKACIRTIQNYVLGMVHGKDLVSVAGRPGNAKLVKTVATKMGEGYGISAREVVSDDCG